MKNKSDTYKGKYSSTLWYGRILFCLGCISNFKLILFPDIAADSITINVDLHNLIKFHEKSIVSKSDGFNHTLSRDVRECSSGSLGPSVALVAWLGICMTLWERS